MKPATIKPMSRAEAQTCLSVVKISLDNARAALLELYTREGWRALGHASWRACVMAEFDQSQSTVYQELEAAKVELNLSAIAEIGSLPEAVLRPLTRLPEDEQAEVWERAVADVGGQQPTAKEVQRAVDATAPERMSRRALLELDGEAQAEQIRANERELSERAQKRQRDEAKAHERREVEKLFTMLRKARQIALTRQSKKYARLVEILGEAMLEVDRLEG